MTGPEGDGPRCAGDDAGGAVATRPRWTRSGGECHHLLDRDVDLELDLVADEPAAGFKCDVPVQAPVLAVDGRRRREAGTSTAVHTLVEAEELDLEVDRPGHVADR